MAAIDSRRVGRATTALLVASAALSGVATAHSGTLRSATREPLAIPTWLFLLTGGAVVGASFLLASFVTDRSFVRAVHEWFRSLPLPLPASRVVSAGGRLVGVALLALTLAAGVAGPTTSVRNFAILVVWVAWWGGYVASSYLLGNTWPALNPFRTVAELLPSLDLRYPERLGAWPSVAGLLALIWIEVVSPLADDPRLLSAVVAGYTLLTVAGSVAFGADRWFETVDPVSRVFRYYGRVAPLTWADGGVRLRLPGTALSAPRYVTGRDEVAFVVAIVFVTTYDGFVTTGLWAAVVRAAVAVGVPPVAVYLVAYLGGFGLFYGAYHGAARAARRFGETYLTPAVFARAYAPSLLAIAAGYHLAHNLGAFLLLSPALAVVAAAPLSPPLNPPVLAGLPPWFGGLELAFVLLGHLVAVWVAHATAYDLLPGKLQAVRSQYGITLVMVLYTMTSLWIVAEPYVPPPFITS